MSDFMQEDLPARLKQRQAAIPVAALFVLLGIIIFRSAWLGDDAFIAFRSIDNLLNGYGLRWNVADRVQVFTDPLWLFIIGVFYAVTGEILVTATLLCIAASLLAVAVIVKRLSTSFAAAAVCLVAMISSKAFVDYSTSGLENPLNYLLVALFCVAARAAFTRKSLRTLILLYALAGFNRLDLLLMLFPVMVLAAWTVYKTKQATVWEITRDGVLFSVPLWGWLIFSIIYFGYAFPNTYYAKIYTGIGPLKHAAQGLLYYINSISVDPVTLLVIALTIGLAFAGNDIRFRAAAIGLLLYGLYIVKIGGDFMSGRFFSVPFVFALALLVQLRLRARTWAALGAVTFAAGLLGKTPPYLYSDYREDKTPVSDNRGIADERRPYYDGVGLLPVVRRNQEGPSHGWADLGRQDRRRDVGVVIFGTPGLYGFHAGPRVHIVDYYGLGDPLISKLPIHNRRHWRVGHYARSVPHGYVESLQSGENRIEHPTVKELYRVTELLTRGPIWSSERFKEILKVHLGYYDESIRSLRKERFGPPPPIDQMITVGHPTPR